MSRSAMRAAIAAALGTAVVAVAGLSATAAEAAPTTAATGVEVRAAHFSPDTRNVDVYLTSFAGGTSTLWLSGVGYGDVSPYRLVQPGTYAVVMRPHDASSSTAPMLSWTLRASAGGAYTVAAVGMNKDIKGVVLRDDLTPPAKGTGRVRVIQAASRAPMANVVATNGPVVAKDAAFATSTGYSVVPAGTWPLDATGAGLSAKAKVTIASGSVTSVVILDAKGTGIVLRSVLDAAAAPQTPKGSVNAGGGGTAVRPASSGSVLAIVGGVVVALGGLVGFGLTGRRRVLPVE